MPRNTVRIIGIDPGFARTGFAVLQTTVNKVTVLTYGCIETSRTDRYPERLLKLEKGITDLLIRYRPTVAALEKLFFCKNVKTAIAVGQARGVLIAALARKKLSIAEFTPQEVKMTATGYGNAGKQQSKHMMQVLLRLPKPPKPDDAADALALAITGLHHHRFLEKTKTFPRR